MLIQGLKSTVWRGISLAQRAVQLPALVAKRSLRDVPAGERIVTYLMKRRLHSGKSVLLSSPAEIGPFYEKAIADLTGEGATRINYFEAGVYAGNSMAAWSSRCEAAGVETTMVGADSFAGLPDSATKDEGSWFAGEFYCPIEVTRWNLERLGVPAENVRLVKGWFDESLSSELAAEVGSVDVAMLDADTYLSTVPVLNFLGPLLADRAWLIFDDWYSGGNLGADGETLGEGVERAFKEWLAGPGQRWTIEAIGDYQVEHKKGSYRMAGHVLRLDATAN